MLHRIAVLSDIHGNLPALEAVLDDMRQYQPDGVIVAGDYTGGPQPNETIPLLSSTRGWMICGNSDEGVLSYDGLEAPQEWRTHLQYALLRWACRHVSEESVAFLRSLPTQRLVHIGGADAIRVVHGSPRNQSESIYPDRDPDLLRTILEQVVEPVLICGHTHEPWEWRRNGKLALNPGAVCGPLNGFVGAQYALLTWRTDHWDVEHRAIPYDIQRVRTAFCESGLLEEGGPLAHAFLRSIETGHNFALDFLRYAYGLAGKMGFGDYQHVPDVAWERATVTFDWGC